jgi:hypothetical protein
MNILLSGFITCTLQQVLMRWAGHIACMGNLKRRYMLGDQGTGAEEKGYKDLD